MSSLARRRWGIVVGVLAMVAYAIFFVFFLDVGALDLSWADFGILAAGAVLQMVAVWMFGELFREGISATGRHISTGLGFRAALVGSSVARLLPGGGAVTPVAMAWTVRHVARGSSGAAVRATALNYAGLIFVTAVGLFGYTLVSPPDRWTNPLRITSGVAAVVGVVVVFVASHLGAIKERLPGWFRNRLGNAMVDLPLTPRSHGYLWGRLLAEVLVLGLVLIALDIDLGLIEVVAAFGVSQIAAGIPGTPGGLGFAEAGLLGALEFFGVGITVGAPSVLVFRVLSYWIPAGIGLVAGTSTFLSSAEAP